MNIQIRSSKEKLWQKETIRTGRLAVQQVDLLEGQTLGLGDEEVGEDEAADAGTAPDEEDFDAQVGCFDTIGAGCGGVDEVGGGVADTEVPEPVRGDGERHTLGADTEGLKK